MLFDFIVFPGRRNSGAYIAFAFEQAENDRLTPIAIVVRAYLTLRALMHILGFAAHKRLVGFNLTGEFVGVSRADDLAKPVKHEPCGFLSNPNCFPDLIAT